MKAYYIAFSLCITLSIIFTPAVLAGVSRAAQHINYATFVINMPSRDVSGPESFVITAKNKDDRVVCVKVKTVVAALVYVSNSLDLNPGHDDYLLVSTPVERKGLCNFERQISIPYWKIARMVFNIQHPDGPYSSSTGQYLEPRREHVWQYLGKLCKSKQYFSGLLNIDINNHNVAFWGSPKISSYGRRENHPLTLNFRCEYPESTFKQNIPQTRQRENLPQTKQRESDNDSSRTNLTKKQRPTIRDSRTAIGKLPTLIQKQHRTQKQLVKNIRVLVNNRCFGLSIKQFQAELEKVTPTIEKIQQLERSLSQEVEQSNAVVASLDQQVRKLSALHQTIVKAKPRERCFKQLTSRNKRQEAVSAFENFDQKWNQLFNMLSTVLKNKKDMEAGVVRNIM